MVPQGFWDMGNNFEKFFEKILSLEKTLKKKHIGMVVTAAIGEALVFFVFKKKKQNNMATTRQVAGSASDRAALLHRGSKLKARRIEKKSAPRANSGLVATQE